MLEIYETVAEPERWSGLLDRLIDAVSARGCIIFEWQLVGSTRELRAPHFSSGYDAPGIATYIERFSHWESTDQDMFERQSLATDAIELVSEMDLYADEEQYLAQPHVQAMLRLGIRHRFGSLLDKDNPYRGRFAIQRSKSQGPFEADEMSLLHALLPHLAKALDLGGQLRTSRAERLALLSIADRLNVGICLLAAGGRVAMTNELFDRHGEESGAVRRDPVGRLLVGDADDQKQFARLLQGAATHGLFGARPRKEAILARGRDGDRAICVEVVPTGRMEGLGAGGSVVISRDTRQPIQVDLDLAGLVFGLTEAERGVVDLVCQGLTNAQIAERRERSVDTINAQVKAILSKARAPNRTQLVRLLCNYMAPA